MHTSPPRLPLTTKLFYGLGYLPDSIMNNTFFALVFVAYNIEWGLAAALVGAAAGYSRIWEAFIDLFFGNLSDKCRSKMGRRRPFMIVGAVLGALACYALWAPPAGLSAGQLNGYLIAITFFYFTAYAIYSVPFMAFGLSLGTTDDDRNSLAGYRVAANCAVLALIAPFLQRFVYNGSFGATPTASLASIGLVLGVLVLVSGVAAALVVKEKPGAAEAGGGHSHGLIDGFKYTVRKVPFLMVTGIVSFTIVGLCATLGVTTYLNLAIVAPGNKDLASQLFMYSSIAGAVAGFAATFLLPRLSALFGRKKLLFASMVGIIIAFLLSPLVFTPLDPKQTSLFMTVLPQCLFQILVQICVTCVWVLTFPMLAEVCDYDEIRTGVRREGVYTAMYNWGCKVAIAMIGVVGGAIVQLSGFDQHLAHQSESTIQILRWSFALGPIPFFLVCMVLTLKFPLSAESNQRLREEKAREPFSAPPRSKAMAT